MAGGAAALEVQKSALLAPPRMIIHPTTVASRRYPDQGYALFADRLFLRIFSLSTVA